MKSETVLGFQIFSIKDGSYLLSRWEELDTVDYKLALQIARNNIVCGDLVAIGPLAYSEEFLDDDEFFEGIYPTKQYLFTGKTFSQVI